MAGLTGMKAICSHMNRSEATMLKLRQEYDFPMIKVGGIWESDTDEIEKWRKCLLNGDSTLTPEGNLTPKKNQTPSGKKKKNLNCGR